MRLVHYVIGITLLSLGFVNASAKPALLDYELWPSEIALSKSSNTTNVTTPTLPPAPSPLVRDDKVLGGAYYDTFKILSGDNSCSEFFGGSTKALVVLNSLMSEVRKEYLDGSVGMRMTGEITTVTDAPTNTKYRLFKKASINAKGPFYRKRVSHAESQIPRLGGYEPNTKEVRALILLHELGHLMKGDDDNWLLPDDGKSQDLSRENSTKIDTVCGEQIKNLARNN